MDESTVSLSNDSILIDDIETSFKITSRLSERIRRIITTGVGGNLIKYYDEFKEEFSFLFSMSSDHQTIRELKLIDEITTWRDKKGLQASEIIHGLKLFEQYKTELFKGKLLRYQ